MLYWQLETDAKSILTKAGVDSPGLCAILLTAYAAGLDKVQYLLARKLEAPQSVIHLQQELVKRRRQGEPLAYILGKKSFYETDFFVSSAVLTPRPETELIVDLALEHCDLENLAFADLGAGSGCIAISLLLKKRNWRGFALELSSRAAQICKKNSELTGVRLCLVQGDIFRNPFKPKSLDLVVSNPPYIPQAEKNSVMWETLAFEPHLALFSSKNGLAHLAQVIETARMSLKPNGRLILEHGAGQASDVLHLLHQAGFKNCQCFTDLANLPRCCLAIKT